MTAHAVSARKVPPVGGGTSKETGPDGQLQYTTAGPGEQVVSELRLIWEAAAEFGLERDVYVRLRGQVVLIFSGPRRDSRRGMARFLALLDDWGVAYGPASDPTFIPGEIEIELVARHGRVAAKAVIP